MSKRQLVILVALGWLALWLVIAFANLRPYRWSSLPWPITYTEPSIIERSAP